MKLFIDGQEVELDPAEVEIVETSDRLVVKTAAGAFSAVAVRQGDAVLVSYRGRQYRIERSRPRTGSAGPGASGEIRAPMPGQIVDVAVAEGAAVAKGEKLLVLEAMKTQQGFSAPYDGVVASLPVATGRQVAEGDLLVLLKPRGDE